MKKLVLFIAGLFVCVSFSGCGLMEMSFRAGFIMALILAAIIGLLIWILHISVKLLTKYFPSVGMIFDGLWDE